MGHVVVYYILWLWYSDGFSTLIPLYHDNSKAVQHLMEIMEHSVQINLLALPNSNWKVFYTKHGFGFTVQAPGFLVFIQSSSARGT